MPEWIWRSALYMTLISLMGFIYVYSLVIGLLRRNWLILVVGWIVATLILYWLMQQTPVRELERIP